MNISGRLTHDATVSTTTTGKEVVNFSVAVNDGYKNRQGEWVDNTAFIECAYWLSAKPASWLKQGLYVELTGQISARAWQEGNGNLRAGLNFKSSFIKPAWGTASKTDPVQGSEKQQNDSPAKEDETDDLPF